MSYVELITVALVSAIVVAILAVILLMSSGFAGVSSKIVQEEREFELDSTILVEKTGDVFYKMRDVVGDSHSFKGMIRVANDEVEVRVLFERNDDDGIKMAIERSDGLLRILEFDHISTVTVALPSPGIMRLDLAHAYTTRGDVRVIRRSYVLSSLNEGL